MISLQKTARARRHTLPNRLASPSNAVALPWECPFAEQKRGWPMMVRMFAVLIAFAAATPALSQTPQPHAPQFPAPDPGAPQFSPGSPRFQLHFVPPSFQTTVPQPEIGSARIDPEIIVRPPQSSFAQQTPRAPICQNLYPNLRILPVDVAALDSSAISGPLAKAKVDLIPTTWPDLRLDQIPTTWKDLKLVPLAPEPQSPSAASTK